MQTVLAQILQPAEGITPSLYLPLLIGTVVYVVLLVAGNVLESRDDVRGATIGDLAFALLILMGLYTTVLLVTALAMEFNLIVEMLKIVAVVVAFFAILVVVLFGLGQLVGLIARAVRRDKRITTS